MQAKGTLISHRDCYNVGIDSLSLPELPEQTDTYMPVPHRELVDVIKAQVQGAIDGANLASERYALNSKGTKMFGVQVYDHQNPELGLAVGFRNSYDKSISVGLALGASVFVCDNLALTGQVKVLRRHTPKVWEDLHDMIEAALPEAEKNFTDIVADSELLKTVEISDTEAYEHLGVLFGEGVLKPRQLSAALKHWQNPPQREFAEPNMWSLYNAANAALKTARPDRILEQHIDLHSQIMHRVRG